VTDDTATSLQHLRRLTLDVSAMVAAGQHLIIAAAVETDGQEVPVANGDGELVAAGVMGFEGTWPVHATCP